MTAITTNITAKRAAFERELGDIGFQLRFVKKECWDKYLNKKAKSKEQRAEREEQRAESREQRAESRERRAKSEERRAESRERRAESRERRAKSEEQRAESEERRANGSGDCFYQTHRYSVNQILNRSYKLLEDVFEMESVSTYRF
ncbi:MAG: hypothetical protein ABJB16_06250 [Saprospiraceae bacterium]